MSTQYRALLIGNAHFLGSLPALDGPLADVKAMRSALTHATVGLFRPENVESLLDKDARVLQLKISEFLRSNQDGQVLLFYYSGHGELDEDGNLYLCASDTDPQHLEATSVTSNYLSTMAGRVPERIPLIIVLDCCNSGAFKNGISSASEALWGTGRYVLTSSRARQLSHAASVSGHASVFTHYLVEGLQYAPSAGHLTVDELNKYVHTRVTQASKQTPQHKFSGGGTLVVARRGDAPVPSPPPPLPPHSEPEERDSYVVSAGWTAERVRTGGADWITQVSDTRVSHIVEYRHHASGEAAILVNDKCVYLGPVKLEHGFRLSRTGPSALMRVTGDVGIELWVDHQQVYPHCRSQPGPNTVTEHRASAIRAALKPFTGSRLRLAPDFKDTYDTRGDKREYKRVLDSVSSPVIGLHRAFGLWIAIMDNGLYLREDESGGQFISYEVLAGLAVETSPPESGYQWHLSWDVLLGSVTIRHYDSDSADETAGLLRVIKQVIIDSPERHVSLPRLRPKIPRSIFDVKNKSFTILPGLALAWGMIFTLTALGGSHGWPSGSGDLVGLLALLIMTIVGLKLRPVFFKVSIMLTISIAAVVAWGGGESLRRLFEYGWTGRINQVGFAIGNSVESAGYSFRNKALGMFMISPVVFTIVGAVLIMAQWLSRPSPP